MSLSMLTGDVAFTPHVALLQPVSSRKGDSSASSMQVITLGYYYLADKNTAVICAPALMRALSQTYICRATTMAAKSDPTSTAARAS